MNQQQAWWKEPTKGQWISFGAAWFGWVMDAFDFMIFVIVMKKIAEEFGVTYTATAASLTLTLVVRLLGGLVAGWAADRWGRKLPLMLSVIWFALCDGAIAFAPSFTWVLVLRTLFGFGMGAEWTAGATLAMENWPQRSRGIASGMLQGSWAIGYILAALAAWLVVPIWGWRALFLIAAAPAILVFPIRAWVPESPEWKKEKARKVAGPTLAEIARSGVVSKILWGSLVMALGFGVYYGLVGLYPVMLQKELEFGERGVFWLAMAFNIGMLAGSVAIGSLAARRGVIAAIVLPAIGMTLALPLYVGAIPSALGIGAVLGGALGAGICGVTPMMLTALFPANLRARCVGLVYHAGAFGGAFVPTAVAALAEGTRLTLGQSMGVITAACAVLMIVAVLVSSALLTNTEAPEGEPVLAH